MNIIVHYPESQKDIDCLRKKAAKLHADAVLKYINNLSCNKDQKLKLINDLKNSM